MQFSTIALAALSAFVGVEAQGGNGTRTGGGNGTGGGNSTRPGGGGSPVRTVSVIVGRNGTTFQPNNIRAAVGDAVQFQFMGGNHTVTQSPFDNPCSPINNFVRNVTGVHSGYVPFAASAAMGQVPVYTIMINNTNPMWLYCAQAKHCQNGMVMVINENTAANSSRSLANYRQLASTVPQSTVPGQAPGAGTGTGGGAGGGAGTGGGNGRNPGGANPSGGAGGSTPSGGANPPGGTAPPVAAGSSLNVPFSLLALAGSIFFL
ncbi:hypothetical protein GGTG_11057 [Gaeumannomyces tritici R3-111a-1]|uniref:Extracellular serine-rich protein n=1 Tax=Gaeumannomyces tritici (strain R3-111a-1) TaxID=644352 RepID=J3PC34_GAET3|nr:hypothetical protein GGTG_11057 [Gaeumannomyces tritici R3-111a-1]EJT71804.1 hypothetical protein GGTG_11057 [Gaeumannomyces tritici R3-111a-1]